MAHNSILSNIHQLIKQRCCNPNNTHFKDYGGRGITVCHDWLNTEKSGIKNYSKGFISFKKWALANGYKEGLTLDRIDNNKGYSPDNCRWVVMKVQCNNKRNNHCIAYKGEIKTLAQWCNILNLNYDKTKQRLNSLGWSVDKAFETD